MTSTTPRCSARGCPVRYRSGEDRPCQMHSDDISGFNLTTRAAGFGVEMVAFDGDDGPSADRPSDHP